MVNMFVHRCYMLREKPKYDSHWCSSLVLQRRTRCALIINEAVLTDKRELHREDAEVLFTVSAFVLLSDFVQLK